MITVVELPEFIRLVRKLLSENERSSFVDYLAAHPASGVIILGTGGIRKLRWRREGVGKSAGVRVIYYYYNDEFPLFLLTVFGKSEKMSLSKGERNELAKLTRKLLESYGDTS
ncbi:MAG: addiction module toxin RelE [Chloroflexi bacterium]|nr:addiction module toxin RelE [Chloroflexota bacterium]